MHDLHRLDQSIETPIYSNATLAELHQLGHLSRLEAEALDIIQDGFSALPQQQEEEAGRFCAGRIEEGLERSCVAIVHEGVVIPILNLEDILQGPRTATEKLLLSTQVASAIFDVLLVFLEEEGGGEK